IRLSGANRYTFAHNDPESLEKKLKQAEKGSGRVYIAVESLYSMDGDLAPLEKIVSLGEEYNAAVIVDEAHAGGVSARMGAVWFRTPGWKRGFSPGSTPLGKPWGATAPL